MASRTTPTNPCCSSHKAQSSRKKLAEGAWHSQIHVHARVAPPCPTTSCVWRSLPYLVHATKNTPVHLDPVPCLLKYDPRHSCALLFAHTFSVGRLSWLLCVVFVIVSLSPERLFHALKDTKSWLKARSKIIALIERGDRNAPAAELIRRHLELKY